MPNYGYTAQGGNNGTIAAALLQPFTMPEAGTLNSMSVYIGIDAGAGRMALYTGGNSGTDPEGATLVRDFGLIPNGTGWQTVAAGGESLTSGARYWLAVKSDDGAAYRVARDAGTLGNCTAPGHTFTGEPADETAAWSATLATGTEGNTTNTYSMYITYTAAGGGGSTQPPRSMHQNRMRAA